MIVVDTNVIASLYLETERSQQAEDALRKDSEWVAPILWRSELRNILAVQLRLQHLKLQEVLRVMEAAEAQLKDHEFEVPSLDVLRLAGESGCSAYDCEFVVLAQNLAIRLLTRDRKVQAAFPKVAVALEDFRHSNAT